MGPLHGLAGGVVATQAVEGDGLVVEGTAVLGLEGEGDFEALDGLFEALDQDVVGKGVAAGVDLADNRDGRARTPGCANRGKAPGGADQQIAEAEHIAQGHPRQRLGEARGGGILEDRFELGRALAV